ncbi:LOW QUALITY PROTEIN: olfactory receptor 8B3-like [Perognathus longimembris pacificus]|uniref:LOW QUALITY PROTEIN: olfactory receptor 8B3-like n=1 Tax=Perognathus longimembris pacificus TaxID=214514 RepID=UPI0020196703|nr:LOW QUALITY PROTEIN: olfactory receptor 8B3-like [Perognathus longimembris pacificus]
MRILGGNDSLTEFILAGLIDQPELQLPLFYICLIIYIVTIVGNLGLITFIVLNAHLHTPMYYFIFNLSFTDLCYSSVFTPKMLMNFILKDNVISYIGCKFQLFFFLFFVTSKCYMLTSMAYDCYVAICSPVLYNISMSPNVCSYLIRGSYLVAFSGSMVNFGCVLRLTFCDKNIINHNFCDVQPLLQLSCTSTYVTELEIFIAAVINIIVPTFTILISYAFIISSILNMSSSEGRSKAFSNCSSHIIAVSLFFGSGEFMCLKPSSAGSLDEGKISSVFYTIVVPMMNTFIYSLRNTDIKAAWRKTLQRRKICSETKTLCT